MNPILEKKVKINKAKRYEINGMKTPIDISPRI